MADLNAANKRCFLPGLGERASTNQTERKGKGNATGSLANYKPGKAFLHGLAVTKIA